MPTTPPHHTRRGWAATVLLGTALAGAMGLGVTSFRPEPASGIAPAGAVAGGSPSVRYGRDIRPILSDRCFQCHGPDAATRHAELRLDVREEAVKERKNGAAIVPGNPDKSELIRRINSTDPAVVMPSADSHKPLLTPEQRELMRRWIAEGASYEAHWAFVAPSRPAPPAVKNESWVRNPIDRFVLAGLEARNIKPSPDADGATLIRRAFLDLTGLPPTPEETDAFLADKRPDAYERWIDKLTSEEPYLSRYAERLAAPWLDQARYADTCGIHMDAGRQMWLWRDWVLEAYKTNMPFDRFVTEQLAGDLFPDATVQQKVASGFNRNHTTTDEGGAIAEEYLVEYAVDRASTTGSVFLGLTVGCARCHDHKFDPISQEDFFSFYAFFNSIEEPGLYSQNPDFNRAYEPFIMVPTAKQLKRLDEIKAETAALNKELETRTPDEDEKRAEFTKSLWERGGISWAKTSVTGAESTAGASLEIMPDGSVRASGANPEKDNHVITMRTQEKGLRLISLEALEEPTAFEGRVGRAENGNAVLSRVLVEAISVADPSVKAPVKLVWAWADFSQENGDFDITNVLDPNPTRVWALKGHERKGARTALLLAEEPFGFEGGTDVRITLEYQSIYDRHVIARPRLGLGTINDAGLAMLPSSAGRWYLAGPFPGDKEKNEVFEPAFGPENGDAIDLAAKFGDKNVMWRFNGVTDGRVLALTDGRNVHYLGKYIYSPTAREIDVSLGSDDGFRLFVSGKEAAKRNTERGVAPDQDKAKLPLTAGRNAVVMKIVNTGGAAGFYYRSIETPELEGDLVATLLPEERRSEELARRADRAWRMAFVPRVKEVVTTLAALEKETAEINANVPRTMVMKELEKPRETFVLNRGVYDQPDKSRPVTRRVPSSLGKMPEGAPADRRGLAQWIVSAENPLMARVTVNRMWEQVFGAGIVRTSEDFGLQGEWPTHPELLDWLAVEFRENGWDVRAMLRLMLTSSTYRQSSKVRPELKDVDPDNRLLASFPRRRLSAEQIRDQALYISGLLVEQVGGPSVKPYQPEGLWQEVSMLQSNTREYVRGQGTDLWRRSLYTYWKRAVPPPSMLTFDAPTRESCVTRRVNTNTPLQALVLWNDEQFLEAARVLAQRILEQPGDDRERLTRLFRKCVTRTPDEKELAALEKALALFKERYAAAPTDAEGVVKAGMAPKAEKIDVTELAAWTMIASAAMNLYETTTQE